MSAWPRSRVCAHTPTVLKQSVNSWHRNGHTFLLYLRRVWAPDPCPGFVHTLLLYLSRVWAPDPCPGCVHTLLLHLSRAWAPDPCPGRVPTLLLHLSRLINNSLNCSSGLSCFPSFFLVQKVREKETGTGGYLECVTAPSLVTRNPGALCLEFFLSLSKCLSLRVLGGGVESQNCVCLRFPFNMIGSFIFAEVLSFLLISMVIIVSKRGYYKQQQLMLPCFQLCKLQHFNASVPHKKSVN